MLRKATLIILFWAAAAIGKVEAKKIVEGFMITKDLDTLPVTFRIPTFPFSEMPNLKSIQSGLKFYNKKGEKFMLLPQQAHGIKFKIKNHEYVMLALNIPVVNLGMKTGSQFAFVLMTTDGSMRVFEYYASGYRGGYVINFLQKSNGITISPGYISFKQDMIKYLADCPEMIQKIKDNNYSFGNLRRIAIDYNENCGARNPRLGPKPRPNFK